MDAERFGRALGIGVRATAKALLQAADAAAAPNPRPNPPQAQPSPARQAVTSRPGQPVPRRQATQPRPTQSQTIPSPRALRQGGQRFGRTVFAPAARAGSVLWFELTGVFFGLFALAAGVEIWKRHLAFATAGPPREKAFFAVAMFLMFGWFTLSSFLKAHRRAHRP